MAILRLTAATLFPVALSALFTVLEHKKALARWSETAKQMVIGITFGIFCILSTEYGVGTGEGVILNVRDAGPCVRGCSSAHLLVLWQASLAVHTAGSASTGAAAPSPGLPAPLPPSMAYERGENQNRLTLGFHIEESGK